MSTALKVLFLSSDTGGGHRASAESLGAQFELLYPGSTYELIDLVKKHALPPYNKLEESYKHLSANPQQWKMVYHLSNSKAFEYYYDVSQKLYAEKAMRKSIMDYDPDVVVSVHPLMTNVPQLCCQNIEKETGRHLPIFTVVTDLATAHSLWFANNLDRMFVASDQCRQLAKERGKVPDSKIVQIGLPIRHQFAVQADNLGDRMSPAGIEYQQKVRAELGLPFIDKKTVLVMGGGEGVGSLSNIVDSLYIEFTNLGIDAQILVVCGRNEKLKKDLDERDWDIFMTTQDHTGEQQNKNLLGFSQCKTESGSFDAGGSGCMEITVAQKFKRILSNTSLGRMTATYALSDIGTYNIEDDKRQEETKETAPKAMESLLEASSTDEVDTSFDGNEVLEAGNEHSQRATASSNIGPSKKGSVNVVGLGFVTKMAEYMVAADVLVSKAGPGTIAEAAAVALPIMLTSFLPGQEEGNVDFVIEGKFGAFIPDKDPNGIAEGVASWLLDPVKAKSLSDAAKKCGAPHAARDIVKNLGDQTLRWKRLQEKRDTIEKEIAKLRLGLSADDPDVITVEMEDDSDFVSKSESIEVIEGEESQI